MTEVSNKDFEKVLTDDCGVMYSTNKKRLLRAPKDLTSYTIGDETVTICDGAFEDCKALKKIVVANSILKIGSRAFNGCSSISHINLFDKVESIGDYAFASCTSLFSFSIFSSAEIGKGVFDDCIKLKKVYAPSANLQEYNYLKDFTVDYPFIETWSVVDFIELYGNLHVEERIDYDDGTTYQLCVFTNSDGDETNARAFSGFSDMCELTKEKSCFRIGQDKYGYYWLYDKTESYNDIEYYDRRIPE